MSAIQSPYGLRLVKLVGEQPMNSGMHTFPIPTPPATAIFYGDPVGISGGNLVACTATPVPPGTPGVPTVNNPVGVMLGASWIDPIRGFVNSQYLPANLTNVKNVAVKIADYPGYVFQVQASGSVPGPPSSATSRIGYKANLIPGAGGNPTTGDSSWQLDVTSIGTGAGGSVLIYDYVVSAAPAPGAGSMPGDPYTDLLVFWGWGVHRWSVGGGL